MHALPQDHTGVRIARLRRERHLTQKALSELSGVPYSTLTKTEQGAFPQLRTSSPPAPELCAWRSPRSWGSPT